MQTQNEDLYDAIVMGGGPAGSCVATLLARGGRRVVVIEKEFFPRYHIGESLVPETYGPLEKMGVLEKIKAAGFTKKFSVQFANRTGRYSRPFYFFETNHSESAVTFQVHRDKFDELLLDHAAQSGAEVRQGTAVAEVLFEGDRAVGVKVRPSEGGAAPDRSEKIFARVIVDATGMNAFLSSKLGLKVRDPKLKKASIYGYFNFALRDPGVDEGATLILRTPDGFGWFWFLPLADDVTSVGVVNDPDKLFKGRGKDYERILLEEIDRCDAVRERLAKAKRIGEVRTISDFSYRSRRCSGPGYVLIGDAYGFLDPVYSTGVFLALKSGELAAEAIERALTSGDLSGESLGSFEPMIRQGLESFRKLVYAFYTKDFSFGRFMSSHPECRRNLIDLLVGNVFREGIDDIFAPMAEFCEIPEPLALEANRKKSRGEEKRELASG